jgi:hypothetical protein
MTELREEGKKKILVGGVLAKNMLLKVGEF